MRPSVSQVFLSTIFTGASFALCSQPLQASQHMDQLATLIDSQFKTFAENLSASQSYKSLSVGKTSGAAALNVGFEYSSTEVDPNSFLEEFTPRESPDTLLIPRFHVNTGYGYGWNAGAFYSSVPDSDIEIYGGELSYSLVSHSDYVPEISVRGKYSQITGITDMYVTSAGLEFSVSKGFAGFTPYAGVGTTRIDGEYLLDGYSNHLSQNKYFMGLQFNLGIVSISAETEQQGDYASTKAKMGIRF